LSAYDFPGNVRELENKVHHALVMTQGDYIGPEDVMVAGAVSVGNSGLDLNRPFRDLKRDMVEAFERRYVREIILANSGNVAAAARQAGMDRKNLWALAKKYDLDLDGLRRG
jgi:two-component system response regulator GlrR